MAEKHEADTSQAVDSAAVDQQQAAGGTSEASSATDAASKNAHVKQVRPASTVPEMIEQLTKKKMAACLQLMKRPYLRRCCRK